MRIKHDILPDKGTGVERPGWHKLLQEKARFQSRGCMSGDYRGCRLFFRMKQEGGGYSPAGGSQCLCLPALPVIFPQRERNNTKSNGAFPGGLKNGNSKHKGMKYLSRQPLAVIIVFGWFESLANAYSMRFFPSNNSSSKPPCNTIASFGCCSNDDKFVLRLTLVCNFCYIYTWCMQGGVRGILRLDCVLRRTSATEAEIPPSQA